MGLRHKRTTNQIREEGERALTKSSPQRPRKTTKRPANPSVRLVAIDPQLDRFLDAEQEFDTAVHVNANPAEGSPSRVQAAVETLGKLESEVIAALFPPSGEAPSTLEDVAHALGMTVEEVKNIADEALRGLRGLRLCSQRISKAWN